MKVRSLLRGTRWAGYLAVAMVVFGIISTCAQYSNTLYVADLAVGWLSRAETAAFVEDMITYIQEGRKLLPASDNPVWWFPTQRTDFAMIRRDIDSIIERARIIGTLPRHSEAYQQGMDDLRGKIHVLQDQVKEAGPFMFATPVSIALSSIWSIIQALLILLYLQGPTEERRSEGT